MFGELGFGGFSVRLLGDPGSRVFRISGLMNLPRPY